MEHMYLMCHIKVVHTEIDMFTDTDFSHKRAQCTSTYTVHINIYCRIENV